MLKGSGLPMPSGEQLAATMSFTPDTGRASDCRVLRKMLCGRCIGASSAVLAADRRSADCWAQCRKEHASRLSSACGHAVVATLEPSTPSEPSVQGSVRVFAASALQAAAPPADSSDGANGGSAASTVSIVAGACVVVAAIAALLGVIAYRRRLTDTPRATFPPPSGFDRAETLSAAC